MVFCEVYAETAPSSLIAERVSYRFYNGFFGRELALRFTDHLCAVDANVKDPITSTDECRFNLKLCLNGGGRTGRTR